MIARSPGRAQQICFVAASVHAALVVPLSLAAGSGLPFGLGAYAPPVGHARELLGGFVLAVVTGYLLGRPTESLAVVGLLDARPIDHLGSALDL